MATHSRSDAAARRIDEVAAHLNKKLDKAGAAPLERFLRLLYHRVPVEEILETSTEALYAAAVGLWKFAERRNPETVLVRYQGTVARTKSMVAEFRASGSVDIARLALANRQVRSMLAAR